MVQCGKCLTQNPQGSKFCKQCGADLSIWKPGSSVSTPSGAVTKVTSGVDPAVHQKALTEVRRLTTEVKRLEGEIKQAQATQVTGKGATAKLLLQAQTDLSQSRARAAQFELDLKRVQADLQKAQTELREANRRLTGAADPAALSQALNELQQAQQQLTALSHQFAAKDSELRQTRIELRDKTAEAGQLVVESQRADRAEADARRKDQENLRLESRLITEGQRYDTLDSQLRVEKVSVNSLRSQVNQLEAGLRRRDGEVVRYEEEIRRMKEVEMKYLLYGGGAFVSLVVFAIMAVLGLGGVVLPLIFLAGQLIVFLKAPGWAFNPRLTLAGWSTIAVPSLIIMLGMSFDSSIPWGIGLMFYFAQPFLVAIRAQNP